jgi:pimeloyl-ACP methyl ester carboxylesterase
MTQRRSGGIILEPGASAVVRLSDGRALGYAEYGDPAGTPVFYFHGTPGSRLEPTLIGDAAERQHVRLIAIDRPGFGLSDFLPKRRFADWPADVLQLADALGIGDFAVVGLSGGGPHAAACAAKIGRRLTATSIVSGAGPPDSALEGRRGIRRTLVRIAMRVLPAMTRINVWVAEQGLRRLPAWMLWRFPDPKVLSRGAVRKALRRDLIEAFRHGGRGVAHEYRLFSRDWQFRLEDIDAPVHVWHGENDHVVPVATGRYVAARIPNCRATYVPGGGHLMLVDIADQILADLARSARAR